MGKAVPKGLKSKAAFLIENFPEKFSLDFDKNKDFVKQLDLPFSKKERNVMSGFITRKKKQASVA